MGFGVIFALVVGALISTIPLLGAVLGPIALTLGTALGAVFGAHLDLKNPEFQARLDAFMNELRPLSA
jgi:sorbitol-specific phosphotransferase system component IIBC